MTPLWEEVTLEQVAIDVTVGHVGPMADQYIDRGIPFLRSLNVEPFRINKIDIKYISQEFHDKLRKSSLKPGDVVIVRTGKPGSCAVIPDWLPEANCSDVVVVRASPRIRPSYIGYVVNSLAVHHIDAHTVGAVQQHFNIGSARQIRFQLPPIIEQDRILGVLGALDDKIEFNRHMNETLEAMARAIFRDWFVDFGPTRAKMDGRAPYLAPDLWSLFPDHLDPDGKPEGWGEGSLSNVASLNPESWSRSNYPEVVDYIDLSNTKWGTIEAVTPFKRDRAPSRAQRILRPGDTIVGTVRPGNGSYALVSADGLTGSTGFAVLRPNKSIVREVIYLCATARDNIDRLAYLADGGAYPAVHADLIAGTALVGAPADVFAAFNACASTLIDRLESNKCENDTLAATRDLLLPKLMSGEIRVCDAEAAIGAAG